MRDFNEWISKFKDSIANYGYYIDFNKVYSEVDKIKVELNILNSLLGSKDIENDFKNIITKYPDTLKCIPILIAKRELDIFTMDEEGSFNFNFKEMNYTLDEYCMFMNKTGLFDLLVNRLVNNLVDYVTGVETGLNSNGRKNRGGHLMEDLVESYLIKSGLTYYKEMYLKDIETKWDIDLGKLSNAGSTAKRFDFVIKTKDMIYAIECNFYSSGGSKLNETARSYKMIATEAKDIEGFKFVWFTDGKGWISARNNLKETFDVLDDLYSIDDLELGVLSKKGCIL
ncbi:MAG: type II restriction endonuclease [bacterium]